MSVLDEKAPSLDGIDQQRTRASVKGKLFGKRERLELGHFTIERRLGRGAMGQVYLARDTKLDRQVALKLIRTDVGKDPEGRQQRLVREAKSLARIDHPNVVRVHEVGTIEGQVFISLEFCPGMNLREWRELEQRTVRASLEVYGSAGRGLAAAHEVGMVHRDFKPDNVIVGDDGRVRVVDFGLARVAVVGETTESGSESEPDDEPPALTKTGAVVGTPAYMAPECLGGGEATAASDQFSFCVALFEALCGTRPFVGASVTELGHNVRTGDRRPWPAKVPGWIRRAVDRGLSLEPGLRFPSMAALVRALDGARRRRTFVRVGFGAATVVAGAAWVLGAEDSDPCPRSRDAIADVWSPEIAGRVGGRFREAAPTYGAATADAVGPQIDQYVDHWLDERQAACRATRVEGVLSEAVLDTRTRCLDRRRAVLARIVARFEEADAKLVDRAPSIAARLPSLTACAAADRLEAAFPIPPGPDGERVQLAQGHLDTAEAELLAGRYDEGLDEVGAAEAAMASIEHAPTSAEIGLARGRLETHAGNHEQAATSLLDAVDLAEAAHHDQAAAQAWLELLRLTDVVDDIERAQFYARRARAAVARAGSPRELTSPLHRRVAIWLLGAGRYDEAMAELEQARELWTDDGLSRYERERLYLAFGRARFRRGEYNEAAELFSTVVDDGIASHGPDHPSVAGSRVNLGSALLAAGRTDEALAALELARHVRERSLSPDDPTLLNTINALASAHYAAGNFELALEHYRQILGQLTGQGDPSSLGWRVQSNVGRTLSKLERTDEAIVELEAAVVLAGKTLADDHPETTDAKTGLAWAYASADRLEDAERVLTDVLTVRRRVFGDDNVKTAETLGSLAEIERRRKQWRSAIELATEAVDVFTRHLDPDHPSLGSALLTLGEAQLETDPGKASATLDRAAAIFESKPPDEATAGRLAAALASAQNGN